MRYSDSTNKKGLVQDVLQLSHTTTASYAPDDIARNINQHYHDVTRIIWEADDAWQFDDSNKSDLPIAITDLADGQQDYELPSTARIVEGIEVLDSNSDYQKLEQLDKHDIDIALSEYKENDGLPVRYDLIGRSVFLYPAPDSGDVTLSSGLKVYFQRDVDEFSSSDTTATPGFPTQFHRILSYGAAIDFEEDSSKREQLMIRRQQLVEGLIRFYANRNPEKRANISPERNWRRYL